MKFIDRFATLFDPATEVVAVRTMLDATRVLMDQHARINSLTAENKLLREELAALKGGRP